MHKFLHLNNAQSQNVGIDAFLLYSFYIYTSIWQNEKYNINNRPKATRSYCKKGLHWSTNRFAQAKKLLIDMNLIKERKVRFKGKFVGNYVELSYINNNKSPVLQNHSVVEWSPNTDGMSILNTYDEYNYGTVQKTDGSNEPSDRFSSSPQTLSNNTNAVENIDSIDINEGANLGQTSPFAQNPPEYIDLEYIASLIKRNNL